MIEKPMTYIAKLERAILQPYTDLMLVVNNDNR
jgi:hypothetical protein